MDLVTETKRTQSWWMNLQSLETMAGLPGTKDESSPTPTSTPGGNLHVDLLAIHMWEVFFFFFNATTLYKPLNVFVTPRERKAMQKPLVV